MAGRRNHKFVWWGAAVAFALIVTAAVAPGLTATGSKAEAIVVSRKGCATSWKSHRSGPATFEVTNRLSTTVDVQLLATGTPRVYAEIPTLGPGTSRPLSVTLAPGSYTWQCANLAGDIFTSNPGRVTGPSVAGTPYYIPVNPDDLSAAADAYRVSVNAGLVKLVADTDRLTSLVESGNMAAAEKQWLVAHLAYEGLGAAYDTFGAFDDEINGRPNGLPGGVTDANFTGFLRLEYGLWHGQTLSTVTAVARQLDGFVHGLQKTFPDQTLLITDLPLRTHEILENALQFELTGETDQGSHTNLATVGANIQGTQMTLNSIAPLLQSRYPQLVPAVDAGLRQLSAAVDRYQLPDGWWTPVQSLTTEQREQLDGQISGLLEQLSAIPGDLRLFVVGSD